MRAFARFRNRHDAGTQLAARLAHYRDVSGAIVLGLPRGGVPVAFEIAEGLNLPLDVFMVRKLGVPGHEEFAMGAVASGGAQVLNGDVVRKLGLSNTVIDATVRRETAELKRRELAYRRGLPFPNLYNATVIVVDDGVATGASMIVAVRALRQLEPARIVVAAPVIAAATKVLLEHEADDVECVEAPERFLAVGAWYRDFEQVEDAEVQTLLRRAAHREHHAATEVPRISVAAPTDIRIPVSDGTLMGELIAPDNACGLVVFVHGSGSSRLSPRNRDVAAHLRRHGMATLLFDLLTAEEEVIDRRSAEFRFDIPMLAKRLIEVTDWVHMRPGVRHLPIGYFGASTGAAAALIAAAARPSLVRAVVSRGGRPDLAEGVLDSLKAPTLLVVGGLDRDVLLLNRNAHRRMTNAHAEVVIVPGATHLFEEPGTLREAIRLATEFFERHLTAAVPASMP